MEFRVVNVPTKTPKGKEIKEFQHKSDFVRLEVLYEFGGIYLDLDAIPLRSFDRLRKCGFDQIFGRQKNDQIAVGLIVTKKNNLFMKEFLIEAYEVFVFIFYLFIINLFIFINFYLFLFIYISLFFQFYLLFNLY